MTPGFLSVWIALIIMILLFTGWKSLLAPDFNKKPSLLVTAIIAACLPLPWWWPNISAAKWQIHASVAVLLATAALAGYFQAEKWSTRSYLITSAVIIGAAWGLIRKMYSFDPIYHWLGPMWDAPLMAALLSCMFSKNAVAQFALIVWGSVIGSLIYCMLASASQQVLIGSWSWWDELATALLIAAVLRIVMAAAADIKNKICAFWFSNRRGGSA